MGINGIQRITIYLHIIQFRFWYQEFFFIIFSYLSDVIKSIALSNKLIPRSDIIILIVITSEFSLIMINKRRQLASFIYSSIF
ncbi:hypothetical protein CN908_17475 [Bacillus thuringiensis]|nr:hypothetical protein CN908_17475 [Bacillus thuringiensis]